jgi:hypothetical protein
MNRITFVKFMDEGELNTLPHQLLMPKEFSRNPEYFGF